MKTKLLSVLFAAFTAVVLMTGCEDPEIVATGISLEMDSVEVAIESTVALVATLEPADAIGDIAWTSSDPTVAAVVNGIVTGIKVGTTTVVATTGAYSASCIVTVTPKEIDPNDLPEALKGSNYYLITLDETSYEFVKDEVVQDLRPDDTNKFLYIWPDGTTLVPGTPTGLNYFGQAESWISLVVSNIGWSGAGFFVGAGYGTIDMTDLYANPADYVFHIALKSAQTSSSYLFVFRDGTSEAKICIGSSDYVDNGVTFPVYSDFARDNEWHNIEIPVSKLNDLGLFYNETFSDKNVLEFLAGGTQGTTLDMDAVFFYKKAE